MKRINPELRRYVWLECSSHRMIAMPILLGIFFFLTYQFNDHDMGDKLYAEMGGMALFLFAVVTGLWGGHKAAEAVIEEVNDKTWDFQRLSSQTPLSLTFGKLFGSPIYTWYGGGIALVVYVLCALPLLDFGFVLGNLILLLCAALLCHATALLSSLQSLEAQGRERKKIRVFGHQLLGIVVGSWVLPLVAAMPSVSKSNLWDKALNLKAIWYGMEFPAYGFTVFFTVVFTLWAIVGVYTKMRMQLRMRTGPGAWIGFMAFLLIFINGISPATPSVSGISAMVRWGVFFLALILTYGTSFSEGWTGTSYRRWLDRWKRGDNRAVWLQFPRWMASAILMMFAGLASIFAAGDQRSAAWMILAQIAFFCRDVLILHFFRLDPKSRRAHAATLFYLAMLYGLLPVLLGAMHGKDLIQYFIAIPFDGKIVSSQGALLSGLVQTAIVGWMVRARWKQYWSVAPSAALPA